MFRPRSWDVGTRDISVEYAVVAASSSGDTEIVAATSGKRIIVVGFFVVASGAVTAKWRSGTADKSGPMALAANSGVSAFSEWGLLATNPGEALNLNLDGNITVGGSVAYVKL